VFILTKELGYLTLSKVWTLKPFRVRILQLQSPRLSNIYVIIWIPSIISHAGNRTNYRWDKSWAKKEVTNEEWEELKKNLHKSYEAVLESYQKIEDWNEDNMTEAMAMIVHTVYHLGAIRQLAKN
jgi:hypothetical protein